MYMVVSNFEMHSKHQLHQTHRAHTIVVLVNKVRVFVKKNF